MSFGAVLEKGIMKSTYTDRVVSRSLKEQMSLIISIYSNISASRLPATVGRRTGDATFLKGPVPQLRLAQLVAELENSLVA